MATKYIEKSVTITRTGSFSFTTGEYDGDNSIVRNLKFTGTVSSSGTTYTVTSIKMEGICGPNRGKLSWRSGAYPNATDISGKWSKQPSGGTISTTIVSGDSYSTMANFVTSSYGTFSTSNIYVGDSITTGLQCNGTFIITDPNSSVMWDAYVLKINIYFTFAGTYEPKYTLTFSDAQGSFTRSTTWDTSNKQAYLTVPSIRAKGSSGPVTGSQTKTVTFNIDGSTSPISMSRSTSTTTSYTPSNWSGSYGSVTQNSRLVVSQNRSYTANYTSSSKTTYGTWNPSSIICPSPTKSGYSFKGWYTAASGGSWKAGAGGSFVPDSDITLYAQWTPYILTINYDPNGGTSTPSSQTVAYNSSINLRSAINKADDKNTNINWSVVLDCKGNVDEIIGENPNEQQIYLATTATETKKYSFKAWSYLGTEYGAGKSFKNEISQNGDTSIILSAIWNDPTISYSANNSVSLPTLKDIVGYTFSGWYTAKTGGSKLSNTYTPTANNTILYARWIPIERTLVTKYYNTANGSIKTDTIKYTIQDNPFYVNAPENEWGGDSYVFLGWSGGTESDKADDKWTQSNRGVFPVPTNAPSYKYPLLITPRNLDTYVQWGAYDYQKGKYITTGVTNYWFGCWTASGKYVKIIDEKTGQISWKKVIEAFVKVKGKWVPVTEMWAKINGEWRKEIGR